MEVTIYTSYTPTCVTAARGGLTYLRSLHCIPLAEFDYWVCHKIRRAYNYKYLIEYCFSTQFGHIKMKTTAGIALLKTIDLLVSVCMHTLNHPTYAIFNKISYTSQ